MEPISAQKASKEHFMSVYDAYNDAIFRFCTLKVSNREVAQDITQEVFTRFWQSMRQHTVIQNERAFLYTLARNLVIDWYRKKKEMSLDLLTEEGKDFADTSTGSITQNAEMQQALKALELIDEDSRDVVLLRFVEGLSPVQIGQMRNESANAVSVRINRAMKKLREQLHTNET